MSYESGYKYFIFGYVILLKCFLNDKVCDRIRGCLVILIRFQVNKKEKVRVIKIVLFKFLYILFCFRQGLDFNQELGFCIKRIFRSSFVRLQVIVFFFFRVIRNVEYLYVSVNKFFVGDLVFMI